jgi:hypothetical protein
MNIVGIGTKVNSCGGCYIRPQISLQWIKIREYAAGRFSGIASRMTKAAVVKAHGCDDPGCDRLTDERSDQDSLFLFVADKDWREQPQKLLRSMSIDSRRK